MTETHLLTEMAGLIEQSSLGTATSHGLRSLSDPSVVDDIEYEVDRRAVTAITTEPSPLAVAARATRNREQSPARRLHADLWTAIADGSIHVTYQPKVEMATGIVRGAEALVRWYHPSLGRVRPARLVAVAERTGAIRPLTMWVLQQALTECRGWRERGWDLGIAVNLSARNLVDPRLAGDVAGLLEEHEVPPAALTLELTETMVVGDSRRSIEVVQSLVDLGVKLSCDDFGTGYSSLSRLRRLPIDEIKVDRSFVARIADDDRDRAITRSVLNLGRGLGLTTVAEGVEDRTVWDILHSFGCDQVQGFLVSRPLAPHIFRDWMVRQPSTARPTLTLAGSAEGATR